jgi:peptidyl-prolyl cis-trans isomerase SurA
MNGILALLALVLVATTTQKKEDQVLMEVGKEEVTVSEFTNVFKKNNNLQEATNQELEDYVDLFVKFKMKVLDAERMQLDTLSSFKNELAGYRKQLARPYLTDKQAEQKLIEEAYDRMTEEVRASHLLLLVDEKALPKDTLAVYQKINSLRNKILNGEDFETVAKTHSEDPSAKTNGGDLGYFSAFRMVYPFESAAFNTPLGEVSKPFRTRFGYHIVKVTDKRKSRGEVKVAHIMIEQGAKATDEEKQEASDKLSQILDFFKEGKSFDDLVRYSDDKGTSSKGGELPWFGTGQMVPAFESTAFSLKEKGEVSEPVQTIYGWHILKLIDKKAVPSFEEVKADIERKIKRDSRANKGKTVLINRIKSENNFRSNMEALTPFYQIDFEAQWTAESISNNKQMLFILDNKKYTQADFAIYIEKNKTPIDQTKIVSVINEMFDDWVEKTCIQLEDSLLEEKYPEFKALMKEYRDGILLFNLMDQKVWGKAVEDTMGLKQYFQLTKENYQWDNRLDASVFTCLNKEVAERVRRLISTDDNVRLLSNSELSLITFGKGENRLSIDDIITIVNNQNPLNLQVESAKFSKGDHTHLDNAIWKKGLTDNELNEEIVTFAFIYDVLAPMPKSLKEAKGQVTSNYQDYLEAAWIKELEERYPVTINYDLLNSIIVN